MVETTVRAVEDADGVHWDVARTVDADADVLWGLLTDPNRWPEWGPSVGAVQCEVDRIERGTRGEVRVAGTWHPFTVETCEEVEPGVRRWTWRVRGVRATGHRVERLGEGRTRVVFEVPLWAMAYVAICAAALRKLDRIACRETGATA
jgi:hypothetical protein